MRHQHPIPGSVVPLLDELCRAMTLGERLRPEGLFGRVDFPAAPDLLLTMVDRTRPLAEKVREGAEELLLRVLGRPDAPSDEDLVGLARRIRDGLDAALASLGEGAGSPEKEAIARLAGELETLSPQQREAALESLTRLLREIGLERLDQAIQLESPRDDETTLWTTPLSPLAAHAHAWVGVFERVQTLLVGDPLLGLERLGSYWWFATHAVNDPSGRDGHQIVREHEWSLVDRKLLKLHRSLLDLYMKTDLSADMPPREREVAEALQASFPGVFLVKERNGDSAVFEEFTGGRRIRIAEYASELGYEEGWLGFGRVCAFDGPTHIRSPGMVFFEFEEDEIEPIRESLSEELRPFPAAIRVEVLLSLLEGARGLPLPVTPAENPKEAQAILEVLTDQLEEAGLAEEVSPEEVGEPLISQVRASGMAEAGFWRFHLDETMETWMRALLDYSRSSTTPRVEPKRSRRARKGKKRRKS